MHSIGAASNCQVYSVVDESSYTISSSDHQGSNNLIAKLPGREILVSELNERRAASSKFLELFCVR